MEGVTLPSHLQILNFSPMFKQSLERVTLPVSVHSLRYGSIFVSRLWFEEIPKISRRSSSFWFDEFATDD